MQLIVNFREKLAIVDETGVCTTFDIKTKQFLFQVRHNNFLRYTNFYNS